MDAKTIFTTASVMVLANGALLALIYRELPAQLRAAARYWCLGTLLVAGGCVLFAFGDVLPRAIMLGLANGALAFGLTAYYGAIREFHGLRTRVAQYLPAAFATACVFWFTAITPDFKVRMAVVSVVWLWLMVMCIRILMDKARGHASLARTILTGMFVAIMLYAAVRGVLYLTADLPRDFAIESGNNWLNIVSALLMTLLPVLGTTAFLLMCSDLLRRGVEQAAATDYLTGLPNRRSLAQSGAITFVETASRGGCFSIAIFDIDEFKKINDTYGHDVGDRALVHVANLLRTEVRAADMIARTGGEEFVVLFRAQGEAEALAATERMRAIIEASRFDLGPGALSFTISAGLAVHHAEDRSYEDILSRADKALYRAKAAGRNRVEVAPGEGEGHRRPAQDAEVVVPERRIISDPPAIYADAPQTAWSRAEP